MDQGVDRLSALSDDLLRRILHFVPSKEAASTSVLSRRWGSLWRSSGAVDLAVRVPPVDERQMYGLQKNQEAEDAFFSCQEAFSRAAAAALAAAEAPVTRLALRVDTDRDYRTCNQLRRFLYSGRDSNSSRDVVGAALSHRAARRVEELRVALVDANNHASRFSAMEINGSGSRPPGICKLASLPSAEILRVLDLTRCDLAPAAFPRLATLRLRFCSVEPTDLQALLDAAPELTDVHLESVLFTIRPSSLVWPYYQAPRYRNPEAYEVTVAMNLPAVTTLVLAFCGMASNNNWAIAIDAPRLRSFVYKGQVRPFQLRSAAPELARADLHFLQTCIYYRDGIKRVLFWQFVQSFAGARALKLKVKDGLEEIAAIGEAGRAELLSPLPNVERLELEGVHAPTSKTAAVAIANLLHCCPALGDLTLKLSAVLPNSNESYNLLYRSPDLDYRRSIDRFKRRRSKTTISMENNSGLRCHDVDDIPGLSGRSFACLETSLRRVSLQFRLGDYSGSSSCLGLRLVKFFAENAMLLEEMRIDSGNRRLYEHQNLSVERLIAPNTTKACFEHDNLTAEGQCEISTVPSVSLDADATTILGRSRVGFTILPLQRGTRMD